MSWKGVREEPNQLNDEETQADLSHLQIQEEEEEEEFPVGFEPINTRSFRIGNIPRNYTYSSSNSPTQSPNTMRTDSPRTRFAPTIPRDVRSEVHNDTLQQLTGHLESPTHKSRQHQSSPCSRLHRSNLHTIWLLMIFQLVEQKPLLVYWRTGSTAQGSRRGQRYQEMRRKQLSQRSNTRPTRQGRDLF